MKQKLWIIAVLATLLVFVIPVNTWAEDSGSTAGSNLITTIITAASVAVALLAVFLTYIQYRTTLSENRRTERRKVIEKTLDEFYGPLLSYLNVTK